MKKKKNMMVVVMMKKMIMAWILSFQNYLVSHFTQGIKNE